jgi:hypothetical protein
MAKIVVDLTSLTQSLLIYPDLGPAMLDNIGGVCFLQDKFIDYSSSTLYKVILRCTDHCKLDFSLQSIISTSY